MQSKIESAAEKLWKEPSERNWKSFSTALKGSAAKYYRVVYENEGKLNKVQDLKKSYAELFDSEYRMLAKVPIFMGSGSKVTGATIYLMGLSVINGAIG